MRERPQGKETFSVKRLWNRARLPGYPKVSAVGVGHEFSFFGIQAGWRGFDYNWRRGQRCRRAAFLAVPTPIVAVPLLALSILAVRRATSTRRIRLRLRQGRCENCGYDLRATIGRCPECGRTPDAKTKIIVDERRARKTENPIDVLKPV
jgi:hypothetical protein